MHQGREATHRACYVLRKGEEGARITSRSPALNPSERFGWRMQAWHVERFKRSTTPSVRSNVNHQNSEGRIPESVESRTLVFFE